MAVELLQKQIQQEKLNGVLEIEQKRKELEEKLEMDRNRLKIEMLRAQVIQLKVEKSRMEMENARERNELVTELKLLGEDAKELLGDFLILVAKASSLNRVNKFRIIQISENLELKLNEMQNNLEKLKKMPSKNQENLDSLEDQILAMTTVNTEFREKIEDKKLGNNLEDFQKFEKFLKLLLEKVDLIEFSASTPNVINEVSKEIKF